jgi:hypothetical protein
MMTVSEIVMCVAWLQAKSQAKPSQAKCHGLELALAWLQIPEAKAKPASHGFD